MTPRILILFALLSLAGCSISPEKEHVALTDSVSYTGLTGDSVKLVKTGNLNFKVKDIDQSARAIALLTQEIGGMVYNQHLEFEETGRRELRLSDDSLQVITVCMPQAEITVRVPSENLQAFMFGVSDLGVFTRSSELNIDDVSLQYLENSLKQKNRREILSNPPSQKDKGFNAQEAIATKDDITDLQISNRTINARANYSTVKLNLFQNPMIRKEIIADYEVGAYQLPFAQRLGNALKAGLQLFLGLVVLIAHLWLFILAGLVAFVSWRFYQRRRIELRSNRLRLQ